MASANLFLVHGRIVSMSVMLRMCPGPGSFPKIKSSWVAARAIYPVPPPRLSSDDLHGVSSPIYFSSEDLVF